MKKKLAAMLRDKALLAALAMFAAALAASLNYPLSDAVKGALDTVLMISGPLLAGWVLPEAGKVE